MRSDTTQAAGTRHRPLSLTRRKLVMSTATFLIGVLIALSLTLSLPFATSAHADGATTSPQGPLPTAQRSAADVVQIVVTALKQNDPVNGNQGIATVYHFASPGNRRVTGPYPRFLAMIYQGFPEMLNHLESRFDPIEVSGDIAVQTVWLLTRYGEERGYLFQLGRQQSGEYAGMWMTEAVIPVGNRAPRTVI